MFGCRRWRDGEDWWSPRRARLWRAKKFEATRQMARIKVNSRTDLFAFESAIYFIMMGHAVFSDLDGSKDEKEIARRFSVGEFPLHLHMCARCA